MEQTLFKTQLAIEREERNHELYNDWKQLVAVPGQSRMGVIFELMKKYSIHSSGTIYRIVYGEEERERKERRAKKGGKQ